jgi:branched-chain amino acid transport system ATP-binding protein
MLRFEDVSARYGRAQVLFGVSFEVARGRAASLLGRNGAGKTTIMKCAAGLLRPHHGRILFEGREITRLAAYRVNRLGVGYVPEDRRIFPSLTVAENLQVGLRTETEAKGVWTEERIFALFPNLAELRHHRGNEISGGEQQMLAIARTLLGNPRLLLLDEPAEGLAPRILEGLAETIGRLKAEGLTILLSEQNLGFAAAIADQACLVESGQVRWRGPMETLIADRQLAHAYLTVEGVRSPSSG